MIDFILGLLATIICGFGMGTLYFIVFCFWFMVIVYLLKRKFGDDFIFDIAVKENAKDIQKEAS